MSHRAFAAIFAAVCACAAFSAGAAPKATVQDLAWMTGTWVGPVGNSGQVLEENWAQPVAGSIAALVRMRAQGANSMVELITIEEEGESLVLHIQQWDPGFAPRPPGPQKLTLQAIGEHRVAWAGDGPMRSLAYARPRPDTFTIDVETADGKFHVELRAQSLQE